MPTIPTTWCSSRARSITRTSPSRRRGTIPAMVTVFIISTPTFALSPATPARALRRPRLQRAQSTAEFVVCHGFKARLPHPVPEGVRAVTCVALRPHLSCSLQHGVWLRLRPADGVVYGSPLAVRACGYHFDFAYRFPSRCGSPSTASWRMCAPTIPALDSSSQLWGSCSRLAPACNDNDGLSFAYDSGLRSRGRLQLRLLCATLSELAVVTNK